MCKLAMSIFNVFTLMGGIAMFLYGMDLMGKSLEQLSQVPFVGNASVSLAVFEKASASLRFCDARSHLGALATALPPQF